MIPGNPTLNRTVKHTLYTLKHIFGTTVTVYRLADATTNYQTGEKSTTLTAYDIRKCIVMPSVIDRELEQSISYISASKPFVSQGGQGWDEGLRHFVFAAPDLPSGFQFEIEDWIVYRDERYDVEEVEELEYNTGWLVKAKKVEGADADQVVRVNLTDTIVLSSEGGES